jgi:hypothetical protein
MKVKNLFILIAVACWWAMPAASEVSAQTPPTGSYQKVCKKPYISRGYILAANCPNNRTPENYYGLRFYFLCKGDISYQNGMLKCDKTKDSANFKTAFEAFSAASVIVLGRDIESTEIPPDYGSFGTDNNLKSELFRWFEFLFDRKQGQLYFDGLTFPKAAEMVKTYASTRMKYINLIVNNAFQKVYQRDATSDEINKWGVPVAEKKLWYVTLVSKLKEEKGK